MKDFLNNLSDLKNADFRLLAAALNASNNGVVITDHAQPDEPIIYCNKAFEELTGYATKDIIGHNCRFLQAGDRKQEAALVIKQAMANGEHCKAQIKNYTKDGRSFWNELIISPVKDHSGMITHFIGIQNDVTKRVEAEQAIAEERGILDEKIRERTTTLEQSEAYLTAIVETIRESLIVLDSELKILSANHNFCDFFKEPEHQIVGRDFFEIGEGQFDIPELRELLINVLPHNNPFEGFEFSHEFKLLGKKSLVVNARQMTLKGKYQQRILLAMEDITERKAMDYRKEDFINIASHEMKTPLTSIKGNLQLLRKLVDKSGNTTFSKGFDNAGKSVGRLERLINELLDVAKMQSGKVEFSFEPFNLSTLIAETIEIIQQDAPGYQFLVTGVEDQQVEGDYGRLEQVMINLLSNAVKYSPGCTKISIHVSLMARYCKVSVSDNGVGISKLDHKRIFERFYRAEETSEKFPGIGIGLYVCNQIIKEHNGTLWVESEEHKGAIFSFTIPILQEQETIHTGSDSQANSK
jgi:PAS domain S-box-containing protein